MAFPLACTDLLFPRAVRVADEVLDENRLSGTRHTIQFVDQHGKLRTMIETPTPSKPCSELKRSQVGEYNQVISECLQVQSGGDLDGRLRQVVQYKPIKDAATEVLAIHLRFDPKAALDVRTKGNFTNSQLALLRTLGVHLPGFYTIKEQEEKLLFPFELLTAELEVGTVKQGEKWSDKTPHVIREVRTSLLSHTGVPVFCCKAIKCERFTLFLFFFFFLFSFPFYSSLHTPPLRQGTVYEKRECVRATTLKGVMEKLLERDRPTKSNIPQRHSSPDPEIRKKITEFQQHQEILCRLQNRLHDMGNGPLKDALQRVVDAKSEIVRTLVAELEAVKDGAGEAWFMLIGDYGGKSFKLMLSDLSSVATNSFQGGFIIGEMLAKDTHHNLNAVFQSYHVRLLFRLRMRKLR